jgi:hypothetical protein
MPMKSVLFSISVANVLVRRCAASIASPMAVITLQVTR